jgi:two-component system NarL family response regulator
MSLSAGAAKFTSPTFAPNGDSKLRVSVIADEPVVRAGLAAILGEAQGMRVLALFEDAASARRGLQREAPDVIVLDVDVARTDVLTAIEDFLELAPRAYVVALGQHDGDEMIHGVLSAGACAYVLKNAPSREIVSAIHDAAAGRRYVSAQARERLLERDRWPTITPRERDVLALIAQGHSNATIAAVLNIATGTVKLHVKSLLAKLGVEDRSQAALVALRRGFARISDAEGR